MLVLRVEKPPVDTVENDWQMASNAFIGPSHSSTVSVTVSRT